MAVLAIPSFFSPLICGNTFNGDVGEQHMDGSGDSLFIGDLARDGCKGEELRLGLIDESMIIWLSMRVGIVLNFYFYKNYDNSRVLLKCGIMF